MITDHRSPAAHETSPAFYLIGYDAAMSGWGPATNKRSYLAVAVYGYNPVLEIAARNLLEAKGCTNIRAVATYENMLRIPAALISIMSTKVVASRILAILHVMGRTKRK